MNNDLAQKKTALLDHCLSILDKKLNILQESILSVQESKLNETKSSVGDKYETGRAMMQIEEEQLNQQVQTINEQRNQLLQLDCSTQFSQVAKGALIKTEKSKFFISIGMGKITLDGENYFCVSSEAPIVEAMSGKTLGEKFSFNGIQSTIMELG
ncbi:MAG: hypothetical protein R2879_15200 [Saprospiraceae bacterium]